MAASSASGTAGGEDGGCILAFTMHHAILDGRSAHLFLDHLAAHYRRLLAGGPAGAAAAASGGGGDWARSGISAPPASLLQTMGPLPPRLQPPPLPQAPSPPLQPALTEIADIGKRSSSSIDTTCSSSATCGSSSPASGKLPSLATTSGALAAAAGASGGAPRHGASSGGGCDAAMGAVGRSSPTANGDSKEPVAPPPLARPPPPQPPIFDRSRLFPPGWQSAGVKQQRAGGGDGTPAASAPTVPLLRCLELQHIPGADRTAAAPRGAASTATATASPPPAGWGAALSAVGRLVRSVVAEERRGLRGASGQRLACEVLHIPRDQVAALKALANGSCCPTAAVPAACEPLPALSPPAAAACAAISTNDAVTALVWLLMTELRGRPMPGGAEQQQLQRPGRHGESSGSGCSSAAAAPAGGYIGVAVDLRRNGRAPPSPGSTASASPAPSAATGAVSGSVGSHSGPHEPLLPPNFFGNGVWCLHVPAAGLPPVPGAAGRAAAGAAGCSSVTRGCERSNGAPCASASTGGGGCRRCGGYGSSLRAGAAAVRAALSEMRGHADGGEQLLRAAGAQLTAPLSAQIEMMARVCLQQDAMVTCWSAMDYWALDFGPGAGAEGASGMPPGCEDDDCSRNRPVQVQALLAPSPPWSAAIMAARPEGRAAAAGMPTSLGEGGLVVLLVVPEGATSALRGSRVVRALAPAARFQ
ncbi:hypothetical protein HXX76_002287 [Chlamydomonas incerta]|uniref:Uncharacterized protein n=1 Tax=Chlamydomonas incerta TaxID=51695 RepID=A0A836B0Q6_CHLIN|nr:hypothetical protein HXX76_002287 [Chlamydomonas incerta]|eukprot:KAG2443948.1 hypothetical protein HXX76_002287 [Chlamydomonas incerta]